MEFNRCNMLEMANSYNGMANGRRVLTIAKRNIIIQDYQLRNAVLELRALKVRELARFDTLTTLLHSMMAGLSLITYK